MQVLCLICLGWYHGWVRSRDTADAVIKPLPDAGRELPVHEESVHDVLQSLLAAMVRPITLL